MELILGKSKTGKSKYIYECIKEDIKNNLNPILFVPSQTRVIAEENYMSYLNLDGIIGVNITTITEYVSSIIKKFNIHFDENYVSKLDKKILLTKIIKENDDSFKMFNKVKKKEGFLDLLNIYMDIFRKENIDIKKIQNLDLKNKKTEKKLKEISNIYEKYVENLNSKYVDNIDEFDMLYDYIASIKKSLEKSTIYFDGYNNFTISELKFINILLSIKPDIKISLKTDITSYQDILTSNTDDIFSVANKTYKQLCKIADKCSVSVNNKLMYQNHSTANKDLIYLSENIFKTNKNEKDNLNNSIENIVKERKINDKVSVYLNVFQNMYKEIEKIAYIIRKHIKFGAKYNDFMIYTTDVENYSSIVTRVFYEYNIPIYIDTKKSIKDTKLAIYILEILNIGVNGLNIENILKLLKLGLNNINDYDISYFENYIQEFNINKYSLNKKFSLNNDRYNETKYDLEKLNLIRENIINIFSDIIKVSKEKLSSKEYIKIIYDHLVKENVIENYEKLFENIKDKPYYIYSLQIENQVWPKICELFDSICKIYDEEKISIRDFYNIFNLTIKDISLKSVPPTKDKVSLADINVTKTNMIKYMFFVGVTENNFPKKQEEDIFFNDYELENLKKFDIEFKETSSTKEIMGLYNIYDALGNVEKELYISMPSTDVSSNSTRISNIFNLVKKLLNINLIGEVTKKGSFNFTDSDIYSKEKNFEYMITKIKECTKLIDELENKDIVDDEELKKNISKILSMYKYFENDKEYLKILEYIKDDSNLSQESIDKIYKDTLKTSVYKLELFKKCPFSYYMRYVLNLSKKKVLDITTMDTGSFMHDVLEKFSRYLLNNNIFWHEILKNENTLYDCYKEKLYEIITDLLDNNFKNKKENVKYTIYKQKLTNTLNKVMVVIARGFNQSEFLPYGYELEFNDNSDLVPIEIKLDNDKYMKIVGKIDRIDVLEDDENIYARVVDYKSSSKNLSVDSIRSGETLQLITYLTAFIDSKNKLKDMIENKNKTDISNKRFLPSATLYFDLSDKLINLKEYTNNEALIQKEIINRLKMKGIFLYDTKILEKMDNKVNDTDKKLIDASKNKSKKMLEQEEFNDLCIEIKEILKNIGNDIINGIVKIDPCKKSKACDFCDYSNICRKNIKL